MTIGLLLILFGVFQCKHFVCDWLCQPSWMYRNKGTFGHPGGLVHAGWQALVTIPILMLLTAVSIKLIVALALAEFVIHYMTDWSKMNIARVNGWTPVNSEWFWWLTGADQFIHQMTYVGIVWAVVA